MAFGGILLINILLMIILGMAFVGIVFILEQTNQNYLK